MTGTQHFVRDVGRPQRASAMRGRRKGAIALGGAAKGTQPLFSRTVMGRRNGETALESGG